MKKQTIGSMWGVSPDREEEMITSVSRVYIETLRQGGMSDTNQLKTIVCTSVADQLRLSGNELILLGLFVEMTHASASNFKKTKFRFK